MNKKVTTAVAIIIVVVLIVIGMRMMRARMSSGSLRAAGGLVAVSSDGVPIPVRANAAATPLPENMAMQKVGDMNVSIALNPYPPTGYNPADFKVTLTDANEKVVNDATVSLNLTMPTMWMPPNRFPLSSTTEGQYSAAGQFTMRGPWRIEVIITRGATTQSVFFDVWV